MGFEFGYSGGILGNAGDLSRTRSPRRVPRPVQFANAIPKDLFLPLCRYEPTIELRSTLIVGSLRSSQDGRLTSQKLL